MMQYSLFSTDSAIALDCYFEVGNDFKLYLPTVTASFVGLHIDPLKIRLICRKMYMRLLLGQKNRIYDILNTNRLLIRLFLSFLKSGLQSALSTFQHTIVLYDLCYLVIE